MTAFSRSLSTVCLLALLCGGLAVAQNRPVQQPATQKLTAAAEKRAIQFAQAHHPELAVLLAQLKEMDEEKYKTAILELSRTEERLVRLQEKMADRYVSDLELWKIDSRVRLLVARSVSGMEAETREQLKKLLKIRYEIRAQQLRQEQERLQSRLARLHEQLDEHENRRDLLAEQEVDRLLKSVSRRVSTRHKNTLPETKSVISQPVERQPNSTKNLKTRKTTTPPPR